MRKDLFQLKPAFVQCGRTSMLPSATVSWSTIRYLYSVSYQPSDEVSLTFRCIFALEVHRVPIDSPQKTSWIYHILGSGYPVRLQSTTHIRFVVVRHFR